MQNRVFFPQTALDVWLSDGTVDLSGDELTIVEAAEQTAQAEEAAPGRRYRLTEAVRIVNEVTGSPDANDLVGRVKSKTFLDGRKAELMESSLLLGENAYDVVPGWLGEPIGTFAEHVASQASRASRQGASAQGRESPATDEDLLAAHLLRTM